jgi:hypothetical protein
MASNTFSNHVSEKLGFYVYRLLDPRNGETFYIGKGKGNRVFQHVKGLVGEDSSLLSEKLRRIHEIHRDGFEVGHLIHRHGLDEKTAYEVEASLIDAFPEVTNDAGGQWSDERGVTHAAQLIERYEAPIADFQHRILAITINLSVVHRSIYEAVRYAWKLDPLKARKADYVLAVHKGLIVGAFVARRWMQATPDNFPEWGEIRPKRWGFEGDVAPTDIQRTYIRHRLPDRMRRRGAANPVKYTY